MAQINQENIKRILSGQLMPMDEMYSISRRANTAWGVEGYEVPKQYADARKQMEDREYIKNAKKKGQKTKKYVTRRGNFLDDNSKTFKFVPGPDKYKTEYKWLEAKPKEKKVTKSIPKTKGTFLDAINNEYTLKNFPIPGPGKYNIRKDLKEIEKQIKEMGKKKITIGQRANFLCEYEYLADKTPGPGSYHPRQVKSKLKFNNTEPKDWIKKHNEISKKGREKKNENQINPFPTMYMTFGKLFDIREMERKTKNKRIERLWGSSVRFADLKKTKSKSLINVPGPGNYDLISPWLDPKVAYRKKSEKIDKKDWQKLITKGVEKSIYYS